MIRKCKCCDKEIKATYDGMCQGCYNYFKAGGTISELPPHGEIKHDKRGFVVCHICGKAYKKLGTHVQNIHSMNIKEYKEQFGLCSNARTTEDGYHERMRKLALDYKMGEMLIEVGKNTRIQAGNKLRLNKEVRLQERINKTNRRKQKKEGF